MDGIGSNVVARQKLLGPPAGIIVDANEMVRPGVYGPVMQEREIVEAKLLRHVFQKYPQILRAGALARLLLE